MSDDAMGQRRTVKLTELPRREAAGYQEVYSNNVNSSSNFWDLTLIFGQIMAGPGIDEPYIKDRASVTMSWEQAIGLRDLLQRLIAAYEKEHAPLRVRSESGSADDDSPKI